MKEVPPLPQLPVHVAVLPTAGFPVAIEADADEMAALARFCGVTRFIRLSANLTVARWRGGGVEITGRIRALCEQPCVVSLVPVRQTIDEPVQVTFVRSGSKLADRTVSGGHELMLDPEGPDAPENFEGEEIDIWRVIAEILALAVDRWPRAPGAELDARWRDDGDAKGDSPFAALKGKFQPPRKS